MSRTVIDIEDELLKKAQKLTWLDFNRQVICFTRHTLLFNSSKEVLGLKISVRNIESTKKDKKAGPNQ